MQTNKQRDKAKKTNKKKPKLSKNLINSFYLKKRERRSEKAN